MTNAEKLRLLYYVSMAIFAGAFGWAVFNLAVQIRLWIELGV